MPFVKWLKVTPEDERPTCKAVKFIRADFITDVAGEAILCADGKWIGRVFITNKYGIPYSWDVCKDADKEYARKKAEEKAAWLVREVLNGQIEDLYDGIANRPEGDE